MSHDPDDVVAAAELMTQAVARLKNAGPEDAEMWALKVAMTRKAIAAGAISAEELEAALRLRRAIEQSAD